MSFRKMTDKDVVYSSLGSGRDLIVYRLADVTQGDVLDFSNHFSIVRCIGFMSPTGNTQASPTPTNRYQLRVDATLIGQHDLAFVAVAGAQA